MKIKYLKFKNWLLVSLGGLMGFHMVGCDGLFTEEYGCPEASYRVKGTVVNEEGEPIEGIGVMKIDSYDDNLHRPVEYYKDTTGADGRFDVSTIVFPNTDTIKVAFHDTDGELNGLYADTTVKVSFKGVPLTSGHGWYEGEATQNINVTLQRADN